VGTQFGKVPFLEVRVTPIKLFAGDKPQDGVAQELQLLVIYDFTARGGFLLARPRTVSQRPVQHIRALKVVSQERFQCGYVRLLHGKPAGDSAL
jgi:hypothetical protein